MAGREEGLRVSILVACHDDGPTLSAAIDSLVREHGAELVVVDDGSTDSETLAALTEVERRGVRVIHQENAGPAAAWMTGLRATTARYVFPFSSDDILVQGATAFLADALDQNPEAAVAWGDMASFGAAAAYIPSAPALCPWHVTYVNPRPAYAVFRRESLLAVGGWELECGIEDWDLWMRLAKSRAVALHVPKLTFYYRRDAGGRFRSHVRVFDEAYAELRERNDELFAERATTRRTSPAPASLKFLLPLIDGLPLVSRLVKVQLSEAVTLLLWSGGLRGTLRILAQGLVFRARLLRASQPAETLSR
jgi:glycosyltransferase involved in cell wall biosynthesis